MDTFSRKKAVVATYGQLAKSRKKGLFTQLFGCCTPGEQAKIAAKTMGYTKDQISQVPEHANLGVGCGNPAAMASIKEGETIVDLGSGAGLDAFIVSKMTGPKGNVIGIDLSDEMIKLARKNAQKGHYENVQFLKGDIERLPLKSQSVDHIISNCVINLSFHKDKVYQEAYRVLKPGGHIAISDIVLNQVLPSYIKDSLAGHIACISGAEQLEVYLQYIKDAGFKDIQIVSNTTFPIEIMLADPHIAQLAKELHFDLDSAEAQKLAASVSSIGLLARK